MGSYPCSFASRDNPVGFHSYRRKMPTRAWTDEATGTEISTSLFFLGRSWSGMGIHKGRVNGPSIPKFLKNNIVFYTRYFCVRKTAIGNSPIAVVS